MFFRYSVKSLEYFIREVWKTAYTFYCRDWSWRFGGDFQCCLLRIVRDLRCGRDVRRQLCTRVRNRLRCGWDEFHDREALHSALAVPQQELLRMLYHGGLIMDDFAHTDNACSPVSNLIVLTLRQLYEQFGDWVFHLHLAQDRCTVICHCDLAIRRYEDLVKSWREISRRREVQRFNYPLVPMTSG